VTIDWQKSETLRNLRPLRNLRVDQYHMPPNAVPAAKALIPLGIGRPVQLVPHTSLKLVG